MSFFSQFKILVVDDVPDNVEVLVALLRKKEFEVDIAENAQQAMFMVRPGDYDLVLLDYMLPDMNGLEVLKQIRRSFPSIELPVIMVTARHDESLIAECFEAGTNDYVTKPINFKVAMARIATHLKLKHTAQRLTEKANIRADDYAARSAAIVNTADVAIITTTTNGVIESFNPGAELIFKCVAEEAIELPIQRFVCDDSMRIMEAFNQDKDMNERSSLLGMTHAMQGRTFEGVCFPIELTMSAVKLHQKPIFTIIIRDTTEKVKAEQTMRKLALFDPLTQLPNRHNFNQHVTEYIDEHSGHQHICSLSFVGIDDFKTINNIYGQHTGDEVLKAIAQRLCSYVRSGVDMLARTGGDEFQLFLASTSLEETKKVISEIVLKMRVPIVVGGISHRLSVSIGVAFYPEDAEELTDLAKEASIALNDAKLSGKNDYRVFSHDMQEAIKRKKMLNDRLIEALKEEKDLYTYFQPQVCNQTGKIHGYEALIRWNDPEEGFIRPDEFIPIAESSSSIIVLGEFVLKNAIAFISRLTEMGDSETLISVNLSPLEFKSDGYIHKLEQVMKEAGIGSQRLQLELTERVLVENNSDIIRRLERIRSLGIRIAIDDFGTGYSSLAYIKKFPINELKIDKSFVDGLPDDKDDSAISAAIIGIAEALNLRLVAEGVESQEQFDYLREKCGAYIQGYLVARPMPFEEALAWHKARFAV
tara:strand:- start:1376 stop:3484 length:2109 start_codon:yes stop_codon:yes gene_type:complete